jgi:hypothetical protein
VKLCMQIVPASNESAMLAQALLRRRLLPSTSAADALHIALAAVAGMEFLLNWNFKHIANAQMRAKIESAAESKALSHRQSVPLTN